MSQGIVKKLTYINHLFGSLSCIHIHSYAVYTLLQDKSTLNEIIFKIFIEGQNSVSHEQ
jgi:hypothetical protein